VAAFGLTVVSQALVAQQAGLQWVGGAFLCWLGLHTLLSRPASQPAAAQAGGLLGAYASTLALTLTNPLTILSFAAAFAGLGLAAGAGGAGAGLMVLGVFLGSALWWLLLSFGVSRLRGRLTPARLVWVNRFSGLLIGGFGAAALFRALAGA
jgi:threonine/homoserine/homoserine lactone efflux protein